MDNFVPVRGDVLLANRVGLERLLAVRTEEGTRFTVTGHVPVERSARREAVAALLALEVANGVALVRRLVSSQNALGHETSETRAARVGLVAGMRPQVLLQMRRFFEAGSALRTLVRPQG